jgi:hypothetical protein
MVDVAFSISKRKGDAYECEHEVQFGRKAGFVEALQWLLDDWQGRINTGNRLKDEQDAAKKEPKT